LADFGHHGSMLHEQSARPVSPPTTERLRLARSLGQRTGQIAGEPSLNADCSIFNSW